MIEEFVPPQVIQEVATGDVDLMLDTSEWRVIFINGRGEVDWVSGPWWDRQWKIA